MEIEDQIINDLANLLSNEERITIRQGAKTQNNDAGQRSRDTSGNNQEPAGAQRSESQESGKPNAPSPGQTTNQPDNGIDTDVRKSLRNDKGTLDGDTSTGGTGQDAPGGQSENLPESSGGKGSAGPSRLGGKGKKRPGGRGSGERGNIGTDTGGKRTGNNQSDSVPTQTSAHLPERLEPENPSDRNHVIDKENVPVPAGDVAKVTANMDVLLKLQTGKGWT